MIFTFIILKKVYKPAAFVISLLFLNFSFAQDYKAVNISLPDGLSQSSVYTISQDETGFLWAGTQDGLNKYDGLNFITFYNQPFDTTSISSGYITSILHDTKGRCWIGTENDGLNLKLNSGEKFIHFTSSLKNCLSDNAVKFLYEDIQGNIFIATMSDVSLMKSNENSENKQSDFTFRNLKTEKTSSVFENVVAICQKDSFNYWIATKTQMSLIEISRTGTKIKAEFNAKNGLGKAIIMSLKKDRNGVIWVASSGGVFLVTNDKNISANIIPCNDAMIPNYITSLCFTGDGALWMTTGEGLYRMTKNDVDSITFKKPFPTRVLPEVRELSGALLSIREDEINKGLMWIGSESNGLIKIVPVSKKFSTNHLESILKTPFVFSLLKDTKNFIWIGTTSGLLRFDRKENKYITFRRDSKHPDVIPFNFVSSISETKNNNIFLGTPGGLVKIINPWSAKPSFKHIVVNDVSPDAAIRHICLYNDKIYVVLPWRLFEFDETTNHSTKLITLNDTITKKNSGLVFSSMAIDHAGNFWLGSTNGLFLYRNRSAGPDFLKPEIFFHELNDTSSLRNQTINDITVTDDGSVWVCTFNGLSKVIDHNGKISFQNFSTQNGLKNNAVYGALENKNDHSLWLSTNGGLSRFDFQKYKFINYDLNDGLQSNEFNGGSYYKSPDNEFFFGGVNGFTSFYPQEIIPDSQSPSTFITSFISNDSEITLNPLSDKKIELSYNQNSFSISFIALHYVNPEKNSYEYMLEGYQKEWTKSGNTHRVNFSQLPAGKYIFKVKGSNSDGISDGKSDSLTIIIHPPFWQTFWFYAIVAASVFLFFWLLHLYRLRLKMEKLKEIEEIRKEIASDFHDELGHKLTTISWFSEILQNKLKPEEKDLHNYLTKIMETSGTLYHTMKDLLWAMDPAKDSMSDLYLQIREFGESLFDQTGVEFTAGEPPQGLQEKNIPLAYKRHVLLIFKEAMHNSFKHSKGNKVDLNVTRENNHVIISLNDNGKGFIAEPSIMGTGLKNVEKRTTLIKGKISIDSCTSGTSIKLEVPLNN